VNAGGPAFDTLRRAPLHCRSLQQRRARQWNQPSRSSRRLTRSRAPGSQSRSST